MFGCKKSLLFYTFTADARPCFPRKPIWRVRVRFPIAFDLGAASTIGVGTRAANGSNFAAFLTVFDGFCAASLGIFDGLG